MAAPMAKATLRIYPTDSSVSDHLCSDVTQMANAAIKERGKFVVGLSGGSLAKFLCSGLPKANTDWTKWYVYFCDERHVGYDDPECTYTIYKTGLFSKVNIPSENVFPDDPDITVGEAAKRYERSLRAEFPNAALPTFDLLLLGMGPDGHTCSLFPGHPLLEESRVWVAPISDSPKPPPERITLTLPVINNARAVIFSSCGAGKADMVKRVLENTSEPPLPASLVRPHHGDLYWYLDQGAAALLANKEKIMNC